ncbi:MAG: glycoside hydrolase [Cytophagales bacterium]|jgi:hypothetical protein|nr:glycoside hydrolase [Cytophagales bacterium]
MKAIFLFLIPLWALAQQTSEIRISDEKQTAATPRLVTDANQNPVLSWTEKTGEEAKFYYAVSTDGGRTFGKKIQVTAPTDISVHAEGMPKVAFKADGTVIATFERKFPTEDAPRASNLYYVLSRDNGRTWTSPQFLHADTTAGKGHSFCDLTRLADGEIAAAWLDVKTHEKSGGRTVKFAKTQPGGGFGKEVLVDKKACECCRTKVFAAPDGDIHVLYRDLSGDNIRDISRAVSTDGGRTFTDPATIHADEWQINGCPHTGPSVAQAGDKLYAAWFTGKDSKEGVKVCEMPSGKVVHHINRTAARHPQLAALSDGTLALVWDESFKIGEEYFQRIGLWVRQPNGTEKTTYLTPADVRSTYPVLVPVDNGFLIAYEQIVQPNTPTKISFQTWRKPAKLQTPQQSETPADGKGTR